MYRDQIVPEWEDKKNGEKNFKSSALWCGKWEKGAQGQGHLLILRASCYIFGYISIYLERENGQNYVQNW